MPLVRPCVRTCVQVFLCKAVLENEKKYSWKFGKKSLILAPPTGMSTVFATRQFSIVCVCVTVCAGRNLCGGSFSFFAWNLHIMVQQKPILKIFKIFIDNLQLKYRNVCVGKNLCHGSFPFSVWNKPFMVQQKPIVPNFKKSNNHLGTSGVTRQLLLPDVLVLEVFFMILKYCFIHNSR